MNVETIRSALEQVPPPAEGAVARVNLRTGTDSTGDEAVWVYVVFHDDKIDSIMPSWSDYRFKIHDAVEAVAPDVVTYVRMRALSEEDETDEQEETESS